MTPFINIHTHKSDNQHVSILNAPATGVWPKSKFYSYGIHPWEINKTEEKARLEILINYCHEKKILALGEIGLDRAIHTTFETQMDIFKKQLRIAEQFNLPVIIHCVKAWSDALAVKKSRNQNNVWIMHGFNGNIQTANQLINAGCYLSFGAKVLNSQKIQDTFKQVSSERIFLETDDFNAKIEDIYQKAANLSHICIDDLKINIYQNFNKVFGERWAQNG